MSSRPNILLIMADQLRSDVLGCYGCQTVRTPNLDGLAKEGALFEKCYVNNPICTPSRASLFTGKHLPGHGVYRVHDVLPETEVLFTRYLQEKGYETALFGKLHVSGKFFEQDQRNKNDGFDIYENSLSPYAPEGRYNSYLEWLKNRHPEFYEILREKGRKTGNFPQDAHYTRWAADRVKEYMRNRDSSRPFFCCLSFFDPHDPYIDYPAEMSRAVDERSIPDPVLAAGESHLKPDGIIREHEHSYLGGFHQYTAGQIRLMRLGYQRSVAFLDQEIGKVLDLLDQQGLSEHTLVIFLSDHGDMLGDHELLAKGNFFYDPCTRVPLLMRFSGTISPGNRISGLVQPHDLAATVLSLAGFPAEDLVKIMPDSRNLLKMLVNSQDHSLVHEYALCLYRNTGIADSKEYFDPPANATMFRTGPYKLNVYHSSSVLGVVDGELFDLDHDPLEFNNLWQNPDFAGIRAKLMGDLMNWLVASDGTLNGSRGGGIFPDRSLWQLNNAL